MEKYFQDFADKTAFVFNALFPRVVGGPPTPVETTPRRSTSGDWRTTGEVTVRLEFHAAAPKPVTGGDSPVRRLHEHGEALRCGPKRKAVTTGPPTILGWC